MAFFNNDKVKTFTVMYGEFKKIGRTIELQGILNELIKVGFIVRDNQGNYKRTKRLENLLDNTGVSYGGQPWSYHLSITKNRKINYNKWNLVIAIVAIIVTIVLAIIL
jgi:hypothetical protein